VQTALKESGRFFLSSATERLTPRKLGGHLKFASDLVTFEPKTWAIGDVTG
jgi:hypothetical protein